MSFLDLKGVFFKFKINVKSEKVYYAYSIILLYNEIYSSSQSRRDTADVPK